MECAVTPIVPAFAVVTSGIGTEQHAAGFQAGAKLPQDARLFLAGNMEQRGIGVNSVKMVVGKIEGEEVLLPDVAPAVASRHPGELRGAIKTGRPVSQRDEGLEITSRSAPEIQDDKRWLALDMLQQAGDVLADIVIAGSLPEALGALVVMAQGEINDVL